MITFPLNSGRIQTDKRAFVMGIVNITPDSFYAKSRGGVERAFSLMEEGADILDLGAESTRPGFQPVSVQEELARLLPVIREIRRKSDIPISIDTRKKAVFEACFNEGADILNDVSSFGFDPENAVFCGENNIPVILTHAYEHGREDVVGKGNPDIIISELSAYFEERLKVAFEKGLSPDRVIVDPGIGFGKTYDENIELIRNCGKICDGKYHVMMALSRKRIIGQIMGDMVADRLAGTIESNLTAVLGGATFIRVHDVLDHVALLSNK